jgi:hypothetical protein
VIHYQDDKTVDIPGFFLNSNKHRVLFIGFFVMKDILSPMSNFDSNNNKCRWEMASVLKSDIEPLTAALTQRKGV